MAELVEYYRFRRTAAVLTELVAVADERTAGAELAAIEAALLAAHAAFTARRYQDAITGYRTAEQLVWRQLDPRSPRRPTPIFDPPRDRVLLRALVEKGLAWTQALPVESPPTGPPTRNPIEPRVLAAADEIDTFGLKPTAVRGAAETAAAGAVRFGELLESAGNLDSAKAVLDRATRLSAETVRVLKPPAGGGGGDQPGGGPIIRPPGRDVLLGGALRPERLSAVLAGTALNAAGLRAGTVAVDAAAAPLPAALTGRRTLVLKTPQGAKELTWVAGEEPVADIVQTYYAARTRGALDLLRDRLLNPVDAADVALSLPHAYYYEIPLGLAECHHALGDWAAAEKQYLRAASYEFLNPTTEAPFLWVRLGTLYVDWGSQLYRAEESQQALDVFVRVLRPDGAVPASPLWDTAGLAPAAATARALAPRLGNLAALQPEPAIATVLLSAREQLAKLAAGLDFWGMPTQTVPIWTYDYLRSVAVEFTQLAVAAERDVINFWSRADAADLTRLQLTQSVGQARSELAATELQRDATAAEAEVYRRARELANRRATDARADADQYATMSNQAIMHSALSAQLSGGDDGNASQLDALADRMILGGYSLSGDRGTLAAAEGLTASRLNRQYEVDRMRRQAGQMQLAAQQAAAELTAAQARLTAADAAVSVAALRVNDARALVSAFEEQTFTPEVWWRMGERMERIYRRYLTMALRVARLMQQAYNFETDQSLRLIRSDYTSSEVRGLLAADALMADIQQFTYDLVATARGKTQPVRHTISLAERHGFAFETQLRRSGAMDFETTIDDFDGAFPGTYAGRIEAVEVDVEGLVPVSGVRGSLTNNGVSAYRVPAGAASPAGGLKFRLQPRETLVLSDHDRRADELLAPTDPRVRGIFQGAGVCSSWRLQLPKAVNEIDYGALTDVRLTFTYRARFDPGLQDQVLAELAARPRVNDRQRALPLRWLYPDAWFRLRETGELRLTLTPSDFPRSQTGPVLTSVGLSVATDGTVPVAGIAVELGTPGRPAVARASTAADGSIGSDSGPWAPLATGSALGDYVLRVPRNGNPGLVRDGRLDLAPLTGVALLLGYSFTPRS